jgi:hypothetical protein
MMAVTLRVAAGSEQEGGETRSPGNGTTPKVPGGISALYRGIVYSRGHS